MSVLIGLMLALQPYACNPNGAQIELNICAAESFAAADRQLNAVWLRVRAQMQESDRTSSGQDRPRNGYFGQMLAAQRTWLQFRDQHCDAVGNQYFGGSIRPMIVSGCKEQLTRERTKQLEDIVRSH